MRSILASLILAAGLLTPPAEAAPTPTDDTPTPAIERQGAAYMLDVCPVSGRALPEDGGHVLIFDGGGDRLQAGREFRFCCKGCLARFEKDPKKFIPKVDEWIIETQLRRYPKSATCLLMTDEVLPDPTGPDARDCKLVVYGNRLVRLCCGKCVRMFERDPAKHVAALDKIVIAEAKASGRITTCAFNGRELPKTAVWFVVGDRAVAASCGNCRKKVEADPRKYVGWDPKPEAKAAKKSA